MFLVVSLLKQGTFKTNTPVGLEVGKAWRVVPNATPGRFARTFDFSHDQTQSKYTAPARNFCKLQILDTRGSASLGELTCCCFKLVHALELTSAGRCQPKCWKDSCATVLDEPCATVSLNHTPP